MKNVIAFIIPFICFSTAYGQVPIEQTAGVIFKTNSPIDIRPGTPPAPLPAFATFAEAPLMEDNGRILVRVSIAGHDSLIFILDTAAQEGGISPEMRDLLGLDPASGQTMNVRGASGPTTLTRMRLPPLTVAGETVDGLNAVVLDMTPFRRSAGPPYAGVLGADFLRECRVFISYSQRRIHLCGDAAVG